MPYNQVHSVPSYTNSHSDQPAKRMREGVGKKEREGREGREEGGGGGDPRM